MTKPVAVSTETDVVRGLAAAVLVGGWIRILAAVVAGFVGLSESNDIGAPNGTIRVGTTLLTFGQAGDGVGVLLAFLAAALLWWLQRAGRPTGRLWPSAVALFTLTAASAAVQALGYLLVYVFGTEEILWSNFVLGIGGSSAYVVVAVAGMTAMNRLPRLYGPATAALGLDGDPLVFAVDRQSGDVRAYFSADEAARRTHVYSVEDDEYAFYTDDGDVLAATVEDGGVVLRQTPSNDRDTLLLRLQQFVAQREIGISAADVDDPTAYVAPISEWQWLQLWPGWLRWMGQIVRGR